MLANSDTCSVETHLDFCEGVICDRKTGEFVDLPETPIGFLKIKREEYLAICGVKTYTVRVLIDRIAFEEGEPAALGQYTSSGEGAWCSHSNGVVTFHENGERFSLNIVPHSEAMSLGELTHFKGKTYRTSRYDPKKIGCPLLNHRALFLRGKSAEVGLDLYMQGTTADGLEVLFSVSIFGTWEYKIRPSYCLYEDDIGGIRYFRLKDRPRPVDPSKCNETVDVDLLSSPAKSARK